jgi:MFS family permease
MMPNGQTEMAARPKSGLRSFWLMFVVEFQNAFSDNVLRWLVTFLIVGMTLSETHRNELVPLVGALFALPFILFSMAGGFFADRFSKRDVTVTIKCAEIAIMSIAMIGLWRHNIPLMLASVFLMSMHSAFFGPSKYGLLPELLPEKNCRGATECSALELTPPSSPEQFLPESFRTRSEKINSHPAQFSSRWR